MIAELASWFMGTQLFIKVYADEMLRENIHDKMASIVGLFVTTGIIVVTILSIMLYRLRQSRLNLLTNHLPGPRAFPFLGHVHLFIGSNEGILKKIMMVCEDYPRIWRGCIGPFLIMVVSDPEYAKEILMSHRTIEKGYMYEFFRPWLKTALFIAPGPKWRHQRRIVAGFFNTQNLRSLIKVFSTHAKEMVERMERVADGPEFDLFDYVSRCALDTICDSSMGTQINSQGGANSVYADALDKVGEIITTRLFKLWLYPTFLYQLSGLAKEEAKSIEVMSDFTKTVLEETKEAIRNETKQKNQNSDEYDPDAEPIKTSFISMLLKTVKNEDEEKDDEIRDEVNSMIVAGNETTSITSTFLLLMLGYYPDIQEKVYQEVREILGDGDIDVEQNVTYNHLNSMVYMERVIKETMRIFPVAPLISRTMTEDFNIGDHTIPKNSTVAFSTISLHRSERYWPDPLKFDPERFLPEEIAKRHPYSFMPFSIGPRNCVGLRYAMLAMKAMCTTVLLNYKIKVDKRQPLGEIRLKMDMMLKPVEKITVRVERRKQLVC